MGHRVKYFELKDEVKNYKKTTGGITFKEYRQSLKSTTFCDECLLPFEEKALKKCSKCKLVRYCGKDCQTSAWKSHHKMMCNSVKVCSVPGKGLGLVALKDFKRGDLIFREKALVKLTKYQDIMSVKSNMVSLHLLPDKSKRKIMSLCDNTPKNQALLPLKLGINGFGWTDLSEDIGEHAMNGNGHYFSTVVYHQISRINHSCVHNVYVNPLATDPMEKGTPVVALKDIAKGEELVSNYLFACFLTTEKEGRTENLQKYFGVKNCDCSTCSLTDKDLEENDWIRCELDHLQDKIDFGMMDSDVSCDSDISGISDLSEESFLKEEIDEEGEEGNEDRDYLKVLARQEKIIQKLGIDTMDVMMHLMLEYTENAENTAPYKKQGLKLAELLYDDKMIEHFKRLTRKPVWVTRQGLEHIKPWKEY